MTWFVFLLLMFITILGIAAVVTGFILFIVLVSKMMGANARRGRPSGSQSQSSDDPNHLLWTSAVVPSVLDSSSPHDHHRQHSHDNDHHHHRHLHDHDNGNASDHHSSAAPSSFDSSSDHGSSFDSGSSSSSFDSGSSFSSSDSGSSGSSVSGCD